MTRRWPRAAAAALALVCRAGAGLAQTAPEPDRNSGPAAPVERQTPVPAQNTPAPTETPSILERDKLLGTIGGVRTQLEQYGISLGLTEASEVLGSLTGGRRTGAVYEGLTTGSLDIDLDRAANLAGATARISAFQIHGRGLSTNNVDNLGTVSSIEANRATRLYELWVEQVFLGGMLDLKLGLQGADLEFATSTYAGLFINSGFGWPALFAIDLPSGGPAYPLSSLGARLRVKPTGALTVLLGVYDGNPSGLGMGDPQGARNRSGINFRLNDGVFVIGEAQYATPSGIGTYKLGAWYNSNAFSNQFVTSPEGIPDAIPPRARRGDWSLYATADQLVWRPADVKDGGVGVFARIAGAPGGRNLVNLSATAGVTCKGVFGRDGDTVGLGLGWIRLSDTARAEDAALAALPGASYTPIRSSETLLELTYQAQILPSVQLQPVFQYVFNPGGGISNPDRRDRRLGDAAIFGVRATITF